MNWKNVVLSLVLASFLCVDRVLSFQSPRFMVYVRRKDVEERSKSKLHMSDVAVMSPLFVTQLAACSSIIGMGAYVESKTEAPVEIEECEVDEKKLLGEDVDIFRDSPLRYAGYLNEVGEAFRPLVPEFVVYLSYVAALSYVFADTASKGKAAAELQTGDFGCGQAAVFECLTFQMLASIIFPSFIINRWVALWGIITTDLFDTTTFVSETLHIAPSATIVSLGEIAITPDSITGEIPTAAGLLLIPLIVSQIDSLTEKILDLVVRPALLKKYPNCC